MTENSTTSANLVEELDRDFAAFDDFDDAEFWREDVPRGTSGAARRAIAFTLGGLTLGLLGGALIIGGHEKTSEAQQAPVHVKYRPMQSPQDVQDILAKPETIAVGRVYCGWLDSAPYADGQVVRGDNVLDDWRQSNDAQKAWSPSVMHISNEPSEQALTLTLETPGKTELSVPVRNPWKACKGHGRQYLALVVTQ